jgi:hypothetical protein
MTSIIPRVKQGMLFRIMHLWKFAHTSAYSAFRSYRITR